MSWVRDRRSRGPSEFVRKLDRADAMVMMESWVQEVEISRLFRSVSVRVVGGTISFSFNFAACTILYYKGDHCGLYCHNIRE